MGDYKTSFYLHPNLFLNILKEYWLVKHMFLAYTKIKYITIRAWNYTIVLFNIVKEVIWKKVERFSCSVVSDSLQPHRLLPTRLFCPWNSPGKNTGVGSHSLLKGIIPFQGLNLGLLKSRQILYHLSHQGVGTNMKMTDNLNHDILN